MSHMPRFWRERSFISWDPYLTSFLNSSSTTWTIPELLEYYCPNDLEEQKRIHNAVQCALSKLKKEGKIDLIRKGRGHGLWGKLDLAVFRERPKFKRVIPEEVAIENWKEVLDEPTVTPRDEFYEELHSKRLQQISEAVKYRINTFQTIPVEWIEEYNQLTKPYK